MIQTEDIDLAGKLVQDAAAYLGLADLASTASFPVLMQSFQTVLVKVTKCYIMPCCICTCTDADQANEQALLMQRCTFTAIATINSSHHILLTS